MLDKNFKEEDNTEPRTRSLKITHEITDEGNVMMKSLSRLKYAKEELGKPRISPHRKIKEREDDRFVVQ